MKNSQSLEITTRDTIRQVAFRHFLEKGYEATNLRKISDEVGIKAASVYFYYKSKQELFFDILNDIWDKQINTIQEVKNLNNELPPEEQLFMILKHVINDSVQNSVDYKFKLRYRLFPTEELVLELRELYDARMEQEFQIFQPIIKNYLGIPSTETRKAERLAFYEFRGFLYSIVYEILISGVVIKENMILIKWEIFLEYSLKKEEYLSD